MKLNSLFYVLETTEERLEFREKFIKPTERINLSDENLNYILNLFCDYYDHYNKRDTRSYLSEFYSIKQQKRERIRDFYARLKKLNERIFGENDKNSDQNIMMCIRLHEGVRNRSLADRVADKLEGYNLIYNKGEPLKLLQYYELEEEIYMRQKSKQKFRYDENEE